MSEQQTLIVQVVADDAPTLIDFVEQVFGATVEEKYETGSRVNHAQLSFGNSTLYVASSNADFAAFPAMLNVYAADVDATHALALEKGATNLRDPEDQFYGDRTGGVLDPHGNQWWISTKVEDVSPEELQRRMAEMAG